MLLDKVIYVHKYVFFPGSITLPANDQILYWIFESHVEHVKHVCVKSMSKLPG